MELDELTAKTARRRADWGGYGSALLVAVVTTAVFSGVCRNGFTWWDDHRTIHHNPQFNPPTQKGIAASWTAPNAGLYVPLTYSYWGALAYAAQAPQADDDGIHLDPRVYHLGSLALHTASALVVLSILRLLSGNLAAAVAGALVFAVHPVQVEPVAWASGAKDVLAGLLSLCAVYQYLVFARRRRDGARGGWAYFAGGAIMLALAMLAKPSAAVVPGVVAVLDRWCLGRPWKRIVGPAAVYALAVLPLCVVAKMVQTADGVADVAWWQRPLLAGDALLFYLRQLLWPAALAPDYGRRPTVVLSMWGGAWAALAWLAPAGVGYLLWRGRRARPELLAAGAVFAIALGPVLGFVPFMFQYMSGVADHYLYLPMLGVALAVATGVERAGRPAAPKPAAPSDAPPGATAAPAATAGWLSGLSPRGRAAASGLLLLIGSLAVRSVQQVTVWCDDAGLWRHTMAVSPDSFVAPNNVAAHLGRQSVRLADAADQARAEGRHDDARRLDAERRETLETALSLLDRSLALNPDYLFARKNAFINALRLKRPDRAVAHVEAYLHANAAAPAYMREDLTALHGTAGRLWMQLGRPERAAGHFEKLIVVRPADPEARRGLEQARTRLAEARAE